MSEKQVMEGVELAWENKVSGRPAELWRMVTSRRFRDREIEMVQWFGALSDAMNYMEYMEDNGGKIISLDHYKRAEHGQDASK